jgi:AcrR family transcriptional regulator
MGTAASSTQSAVAAGKARQRRRTRAAIVAAAQGLLGSGSTPSVSQIADAADVSRRTIYQHFPTLDQLLLDATVGQLAETPVGEAIEAADPGGDVQRRVAAMVRALCGMSAETLGLGRSLVGLTVTSPSTEAGGPRRGYRRIAWIEQALEPLRGLLAEEVFERLVSALAMVVGWEALIVLEDVRGLAPQARTETSLWAARALIEATLREAAATN